MATRDCDSSYINKEEVDDMTTCCICTEIYTDPKALPCIHTFCMNCLMEHGLKSGKGPGDEMPCPICRRLFKIPPEGFSGLPKHFFIERLIQASTFSDPLSTSARSKCDACLEEYKEAADKDIPTADAHCVDCDQKFCAECCRQHKKFKLTMNHKLIPINEYRGDQNVMTHPEPNVCKVHEHKVLDVYCVDCKRVVCVMCFFEVHGSHKGSHVSKCVDGFRKQIGSIAETINECRSRAETKKAELLKAKETIQEVVGKLECDVTNRKDELKELTRRHEESLIHDLCWTKQSKLKEIQIATDDVDTYISSLETYKSCCQKIMAEGSASDICQAYADLSIRAMELKQQLQATLESEFQSFNYCFRKSDLEAFLQETCGNLFGKIEDLEDTQRPRTMKEAETKHYAIDANQIVGHKGNDSLRLQDVEKELLDLKRILEEERTIWATERKQFQAQALELRQEPSDPLRKYKEKPNLIKKFDLVHSVWGLAMLNKELFVVSADSEVIFVYDSVSYKRLRKISLGGSAKPRDIAACPQKNCLIVVTTISYSSLTCIDHKGKILKQWRAHYEPHNLSVMPSGNILLTCNARILIYSSEGKLIQDFSLDAKALDMSWQTIISKSGNYLVCQGWMGSKHHRVLSLSPEGVILKSFGSGRQRSDNHLSNPVFMAMDSDGLVFVADSGNNRVVLLSQKLIFMKELLNENDDLTEPYRVLLDEDKGLLYVGTNNRQLLIFNVLK